MALSIEQLLSGSNDSSILKSELDAAVAMLVRILDLHGRGQSLDKKEFEGDIDGTKVIWCWFCKPTMVALLKEEKNHNSILYSFPHKLPDSKDVPLIHKSLPVLFDSVLRSFFAMELEDYISLFTPRM